ncbi:hypothetical protein [Bdellovibrio sp. HCB-162]|uniref:hypothetical protein n=1 Tax=Bdellovibrio sp. HCB-162 TaxID=3394234 RepID=UPI0039BD71F7
MSRIKCFSAQLLFITGLLTAGGLIATVNDTKPVVIESEESKTKDLTSVFNEIRWIPGKDQDVWMMNQSHFGRHPGADKWERLAIVIDKTQKPMVARYYQLEPGALVWEKDLPQKRVEYRASCFICHNNGPRALRPLSESAEASLKWPDRLKIQLWNLRIKTYGRIRYSPEHDQEDSSLRVPFGYHTKEDRDELKVKTCIYCHNESGFLARGFLQRQQTGTIASLVQRGEMPPPGFSLSEKEKYELQDFLRGF